MDADKTVNIIIIRLEFKSSRNLFTIVMDIIKQIITNINI
jgi:hypothetical protein